MKVFEVIDMDDDCGGFSDELFEVYYELFERLLSATSRHVVRSDLDDQQYRFVWFWVTKQQHYNLIKVL